MLLLNTKNSWKSNHQSSNGYSCRARGTYPMAESRKRKKNLCDFKGSQVKGNASYVTVVPWTLANHQRRWESHGYLLVRACRHAKMFQKSHKAIYDAVFAINPSVIQPSLPGSFTTDQIQEINSYITRFLFHNYSLMRNCTLVPCYMQLFHSFRFLFSQKAVVKNIHCCLTKPHKRKFQHKGEILHWDLEGTVVNSWNIFDQKACRSSVLLGSGVFPGLQGCSP